MKGTRGEVNIYKSDIVSGEYVVAVVNWTNEDVTLDVDMEDVFRDEVSRLPSISSQNALPHFLC